MKKETWHSFIIKNKKQNISHEMLYKWIMGGEDMFVLTSL